MGLQHHCTSSTIQHLPDPSAWPDAVIGPRSLFIFPENPTKSLSWLVDLIPRKKRKIPHWLCETGSKEGMKSGPPQVEPWGNGKGSKIHDLSWSAKLPITESCLCILFWLPRLKSTSWVFFSFPTQPQANLVLSQIKSHILKLHSLETQRHEGMEVLRIFRNVWILWLIFWCFLSFCCLELWCPVFPGRLRREGGCSGPCPVSGASSWESQDWSPRAYIPALHLVAFPVKTQPFSSFSPEPTPDPFIFIYSHCYQKISFFKCILSLCSPSSLSLKYQVRLLQELWQLHHILFSVKSLPKSLQLLWKLTLFLEPLDVQNVCNVLIKGVLVLNANFSTHTAVGCECVDPILPSPLGPRDINPASKENRDDWCRTLLLLFFKDCVKLSPFVIILANTLNTHQLKGYNDRIWENLSSFLSHFSQHLSKQHSERSPFCDSFGHFKWHFRYQRIIFWGCIFKHRPKYIKQRDFSVGSSGRCWSVLYLVNDFECIWILILPMFSLFSSLCMLICTIYKFLSQFEASPSCSH